MADHTINGQFKLLDAFAKVKGDADPAVDWEDTANGVVHTSPTFKLSSSLLSGGYNALKVVVNYEGFQPDGDNVSNVDEIRAVIEQAVDGLWIPLGGQDKEVRGEASRRLQIIDLAPRPIDPGQNVQAIPQGNVTAYLSQHDVNLSAEEDLRVRFYLKPVTNALTHVTLNVSVIPYQR